jgi:hypothetical protein
MTAGLVRGESIMLTAEYLRTQLASSAISLARESAARWEEACGHLPSVRASDWYPRQLHAELMNLVVEASDDEKAAFRGLVSCGKFVAARTQDRFLKTALGLMTPAMFARMASRVWALDFRGGAFQAASVDEAEKRLELRLSGVAGYRHIAAANVGWIAFVMEQLGHAGARVGQVGWSLASPDPAEIIYEVAWS